MIWAVRFVRCWPEPFHVASHTIIPDLPLTNDVIWRMHFAKTYFVSFVVRRHWLLASICQRNESSFDLRTLAATSFRSANTNRWEKTLRRCSIYSFSQLNPNWINRIRFLQMIGRAGRAGYGESGESILICAERDNAQVTQLLCSPMDEACSQLHLNEGRALNALVLSAVGLNLATTRTELEDLTKHTLMYVQANRSGMNVAKMVHEKIAKLIRSKALQVKSSSRENAVNTSTELDAMNTQCSPNGTLRLPLTQKTVVLKPSTKLEVSSLGMSSFKSGIDLDKLKIIYANLRQAQRSLVLIDYFHLLYLVTPADDNYSYHTQPEPSIFYSKVCIVLVHTSRVIIPISIIDLCSCSVHISDGESIARGQCDWHHRIDCIQIDVWSSAEGNLQYFLQHSIVDEFDRNNSHSPKWRRKFVGFT